MTFGSFWNYIFVVRLVPLPYWYSRVVYEEMAVWADPQH